MRQSLSVSFEWVELKCPVKGWGFIKTIPAVYRVEFTRSIPMCYIGETHNLRNRIRIHRRGSGDPVTNLGELWKSNESRDTLRVLTASKILIAGGRITDLSLKVNRLLVESSAVVMAMRRADMVLLNRGHLMDV